MKGLSRCYAGTDTSMMELFTATWRLWLRPCRAPFIHHARRSYSRNHDGGGVAWRRLYDWSLSGPVTFVPAVPAVLRVAADCLRTMCGFASKLWGVCCRLRCCRGVMAPGYCQMGALLAYRKIRIYFFLFLNFSSHNFGVSCVWDALAIGHAYREFPV